MRMPSKDDQRLEQLGLYLHFVSVPHLDQG